MPTHRGTCMTTYAPVCNQLVSWSGHRHSGDCNLGVCPWRAPFICRKGIKVSPRLSQGHGQVRAGRACHTDPSPHPQPQRLDGRGFGERTEAVPSPVHTGFSSSLAPGRPGGPAHHPAVPSGRTPNRADNRQPRGKGLLTVFKIESMEVQALDQVPQGLGFEGRHARVTHFPGGRKSEERWAGVASRVPPLIPGAWTPGR